MANQSSEEPVASAAPIERPATPFYRQVNVVALSLLIIVLAIYLLREFATVLQQLFIAAFLAHLILPMHFWMVRRRVPPLLSFAVILLLFLGGAFGLGLMMYHSVEDFSANWAHYQKNVEKMTRQLGEQLPEPTATKLREYVRQEEPSIGGWVKMVQSALGTFVGFLSQVVLVLIYLVFLLAERVNLGRRLEKGFAGQQSIHAVALVERIQASIGEYLAVKTAMSLAGGLLTTAVLLVFGVDYAVLFGIMAFLLNYIPYLGCWVAVLLPVVLALVQFESPWEALILLVLLLAMQNVIGYVIEPRLAGSRLNLSPLVIILSLAFWGTLWGVVGMILAVPLVVVVKSILENIPETRPLATLLSNE